MQNSRLGVSVGESSSFIGDAGKGFGHQETCLYGGYGGRRGIIADRNSCSLFHVRKLFSVETMFSGPSGSCRHAHEGGLDKECEQKGQELLLNWAYENFPQGTPPRSSLSTSQNEDGHRVALEPK